MNCNWRLSSKFNRKNMSWVYTIYYILPIVDDCVNILYDNNIKDRVRYFRVYPSNENNIFSERNDVLRYYFGIIYVRRRVPARSVSRVFARQHRKYKIVTVRRAIWYYADIMRSVYICWTQYIVLYYCTRESQQTV